MTGKIGENYMSILSELVHSCMSSRNKHLDYHIEGHIFENPIINTTFSYDRLCTEGTPEVDASSQEC